MLIDCGLFRGSDMEGETLQAVAEDIAHTTNGHLNVVVATHEHQDHLSGFWYAREVFRAKITVGQVWLAWTEKLSDPRAAQLKATMTQFTQQLGATVTRLHQDSRREFGPGALSAVESVLEFAGLGEPLAAGERLSINQKALEFLKGLPQHPTQPVIYHEPGTVTLINELPQIRFFILGPPRSELIKKSDPSKRQSEVYHLAGRDRSNYAMMVPAWDDEETDNDRRDSMPFDVSYQVSIVDAQNDAFFRETYFNDTTKQPSDQRYRRIDDDWLHAVGNLALQLDEDTNNTSLVVAIELTESGKVLLFPGDAQVGNWLSWHDCHWADQADLSAGDLLSRTVVYKVGHHGSHNATLGELGLERMTAPDLVAMIPVDEDFARNKKKWDMPFGRLYNRLVEKTQGRLIRSDGRSPTIPNEKYPLVTDATEQRQFLATLRHSPAKRPGTDRPLWTEFDVSG